MTPTKYDEIKDIMQQHVHTIYYDKTLTEPSIAYTETISSPSLGRVEKIFINDSDEEMAKFLYMHECGHILFGHTVPYEERINIYLKSKFVGAYRKLKNYFGHYSETFFNYFISYFMNIVMDLEVNSRLFSKEEWEYFSVKIQKFLKTDEQVGIWPEYYDLPVGLTWNEYLTIMLLEPELYFEKMRILNTLANIKKKMGKGSDFNGVLSESDYQRIKNLARSKVLSPDEMQKFKKNALNHNSGFGIPTGSMDGYSTAQSRPCYVKLTKYVSMPDLVEKVKKLLVKDKETLSIRNQMYYSNRRKYNTSIIIPKTIKYTNKREKPDLYLLFDISGSIDANSVNDFLKTFEKFKSEFVHTKIVFWDTDYVASIKLGDPLPNLYGGGTNMAPGIKYIANNYKIKKDDVFFMISDFIDNLQAWETQLPCLKCKKYAIDWNPHKLSINPGFAEILKNDEPVDK